MGKFKGFFIKSAVFAINAGLVAWGVFFLKGQQEKKHSAEDLAGNKEINDAQQQLAQQAQELQKIVQQNRDQKAETIANNPTTVTVQKPTTVTETIPGKTTKVKVPASSSSSSSSSSSKTTTKKS